MIERWKETLAARASEWGLPEGGEWRVLFHNNYQAANSTVNLLWFHRSEEFPRVVAKMCREKGILAAEYRNLQTAYGVAPSHVPRPMCFETTGDFGMLWMGGAPGRRIPPGSRYSDALLSRLVDMLVSIHRGVNRGIGAASTGRHERLVAAPLQALLRHTKSRAVRQGCLSLLETATPDWLETLPVIPQHGDLFLDNILLHGSECHIVDWETFGSIDLPFYDLLTLMLSFIRALEDAPEPWEMSLKRRIPRLIEQYARGLELPASTVVLMLPVTLANWFYVHWAKGRAAAKIIYPVVERYFEEPKWRDAFVGG